MEVVVKKDKYSVKHYPGKILNHKREGNLLWFYTDETVMEVRVVSDKIIRFRYAADGFFQKDFSYAVADEATSKKSTLKFKEDSTKFELATTAVVCHIYKKNIRVVIYNR